MKGLVLAGGKATRLYPTTKVINKHLLPVWDKPLIMYAIEALRDAGITDIYISLSYDQPELFIKLLGKGEELGVNLGYIIHGAPKGISYGIYEARHFLQRDLFVVYLGDNIFTEGIKPLVDEFRVLKKPMVYLKKVDDPRRYGHPIFNSKGDIKKFIEKPKHPQNEYGVLGVYCLTPDFFKNYSKIEASWRGEYEITDALNLLLPNVGYTYYEGDWIDCGVVEDLYRAATWRRNQSSA